MPFNFSEQLSNSPLPPTIGKRANFDGGEVTISEGDISTRIECEYNYDQHTIIVHLDGNLSYFQSEFNGQTSFEAPQKGELIILPAKSRYLTTVHGKTARYANIHIEPNYLNEMIGRGEAKINALFGRFDKFVYQSVNYLDSLLAERDDVSRMLSENLLHTLSLHFFKTYDAANRLPKKIERQGLTERAKKSIAEFIEAQIAEQITLEMLAKHVRMTKHNFLTAFRYSFNQTPAQYIITERLRHARRLLSTTRKDITTIAFETGFSSHSHLTTTFKKHAGLTPQEYRQT